MKFSSFVFMACLPLAACGAQQSAPPPEAPAPMPEPPVAEAPVAPVAEAGAAAPAEAVPAPAGPLSIEVALQAKSGSTLTGSATLTETGTGVRVAIHIEKVKPGAHGSHIHEKGDCTAADGSSAGGHYNPHAHEHGLPVKAQRHLGDLGNIEVGKDGKGQHEISIEGANLKPNDPNSFIGRAIIIHEKKDDGGQPVGNAGGRIGCGEIK